MLGCYDVLLPLHDGIIAEFNVDSPGPFIKSSLSDLHGSFLVVDGLT